MTEHRPLQHALVISYILTNDGSSFSPDTIVEGNEVGKFFIAKISPGTAVKLEMSKLKLLEDVKSPPAKPERPISSDVPVPSNTPYFCTVEHCYDARTHTPFKTLDMLETHNSIYHKNEVQFRGFCPVTDCMQCNHATGVTPTISAQYWCPSCHNSFSDEKSRDKHFLALHGFSCTKCSERFMGAQAVTDHIRDKHKSSALSNVPSSYAPQRYRCNQCGQTFEFEDELQIHSLTDHNKESEPPHIVRQSTVIICTLITNY